MTRALPETFESALARAKTQRVPVMALRPHHEGPKDRMDDIVVENVKKFRAEQMDADTWWMCCYFDNDERVTFGVHRDKRPAGVSVWVQEMPSEWLDWDQLRKDTASA